MPRDYTRADGVCVLCKQEYPDQRYWHELARYVVLMPPDAPRPTPTPVFAPHELPMPGRARSGYVATYCKRHAYEIAGIPLPA